MVIMAIASPTAIAAANPAEPIVFATATPTSADNIFPPMTGQGCANGLAGTANTSTAEAPIGATSQIGVTLANAAALDTATRAMAAKAPMHAKSRSNGRAPASRGWKRSGLRRKGLDPHINYPPAPAASRFVMKDSITCPTGRVGFDLTGNRQSSYFDQFGKPRPNQPRSVPKTPSVVSICLWASPLTAIGQLEPFG